MPDKGTEKSGKLEVDFSDLKEIFERLVKEKDEKDRKWDLTITRETNGYVLDGFFNSDVRSKEVIEDYEVDELKSGESLLWTVMEYFGFGGSKHDKERIMIVRKKQK